MTSAKKMLHTQTYTHTLTKMLEKNANVIGMREIKNGTNACSMWPKKLHWSGEKKEKKKKKCTKFVDGARDANV